MVLVLAHCNKMSTVSLHFSWQYYVRLCSQLKDSRNYLFKKRSDGADPQYLSEDSFYVL